MSEETLLNVAHFGPLAHLFATGEGWHAADLLLYGVTGAALVAGIGLFLRGRS